MAEMVKSLSQLTIPPTNCITMCVSVRLCVCVCTMSVDGFLYLPFLLLCVSLQGLKWTNENNYWYFTT